MDAAMGLVDRPIVRAITEHNEVGVLSVCVSRNLRHSARGASAGYQASPRESKSAQLHHARRFVYMAAGGKRNKSTLWCVNRG